MFSIVLTIVGQAEPLLQSNKVVQALPLLLWIYLQTYQDKAHHFLSWTVTSLTDSTIDSFKI